MDGIARIVNACLTALRPVLHALWREKCLEIMVFSKRNVGLHPLVQKFMIFYALLMQMLEPNPGPLHAHEFETYDFEAMYPNIPDAALQDIMHSSTKANVAFFP